MSLKYLMTAKKIGHLQIIASEVILWSKAMHICDGIVWLYFLKELHIFILWMNKEWNEKSFVCCRLDWLYTWRISFYVVFIWISVVFNEHGSSRHLERHGPRNMLVAGLSYNFLFFCAPSSVGCSKPYSRVYLSLVKWRRSFTSVGKLCRLPILSHSSSFSRTGMCPT